MELSYVGAPHGPYIGGILRGLPAGLRYDEATVGALLRRRAPGGAFSTKRKEPDLPEVLSGIVNGVTDGSPVEVRFRNVDTRPADYGEGDGSIPRPSHADYPAYVKSGGSADLRGGGIWSGRMTAVLTFFGGLTLPALRERGVTVGGHLLQIGAALDTPFDPLIPGDVTAPGKKEFPAISDASAVSMQREIEAARAEGDSVGSAIELCACGLPVGLGEHPFGSAEAILSGYFWAIPGVKAVEFGDGRAFASLHGSAAADGYRFAGERLVLTANHCGGIAGGMTTGAPLLTRLTFKPTPTIAKPLPTVDLKSAEEVTLVSRGRHDPCIGLRALPAAEAALALGLTELFIAEGAL